MARHLSRRKRLEKELKRSKRISLAIAVAPIICIVLEFVSSSLPIKFFRASREACPTLDNSIAKELPKYKKKSVKGTALLKLKKKRIDATITQQNANNIILYNIF
ncbi:TPA: hypothetical protein ACGO3A_000876 [Streptococcus suis]